MGRQELRFGLPSLCTWRYRGEHAYVEVSSTFLLVYATLSVEVGARF
jgi:hypothetical protein